jgi:hypothetical protein
MRVTDFLKAVRKEIHKHVEPSVSDYGWIKTMDIVPLLGMKTLAGVRGPVARIVKAGFAEERRIKYNRLAYRLSPRFKTWTKAHEAALALEAFKAPEGWLTLTQYARKNRRTVRGIQYRIDGADIDRKVFRTPRPVPHYRKTDLDRILRKAS